MRSPNFSHSNICHGVRKVSSLSPKGHGHRVTSRKNPKLRERPRSPVSSDHGTLGPAWIQDETGHSLWMIFMIYVGKKKL